MRTKLLSNLIGSLPATIAIVILLLFSSAGKTKDSKDLQSVEEQCCGGYRITINQLRQFMLDSLSTGAFEGGIYAKRDLLKAINNTGGDSVYMMNGLIDCILNEGNGMFITSPETGTVHVISKNPYCVPCPGKACCPQAICATRIRRACVKFRRLTESQATTQIIDANGNSVK